MFPPKKKKPGMVDQAGAQAANGPAKLPKSKLKLPTMGLKGMVAKKGLNQL